MQKAAMVITWLVMVFSNPIPAEDKDDFLSPDRCQELVNEFVQFGRIRELGVRCSGVDLPPIEDSLRRAFLAGRLTKNQSQKVAATLLSPTIEAADYISRTGPSTITFQAKRIDKIWDIACVVSATLTLPDSQRIRSGPLPPADQMDHIGSDYFTSLPLGKQAIRLELEAWIYDMQKTEEQFGVGGNFWYPPYISSDNSKYCLYGSRFDESWDEFWPQLKASNLAVWHGIITTKPKQITIVDKLPSDFPKMVKDDSLARSINSALSIGSILFNNCKGIPARISLNYDISVCGEIPVPIVGILRIASPRGLLLTESGFILNEVKMNFFDTKRVVFEKSELRSDAVEWISSYSIGDSAAVIVSILPDHDMAAARPGLNSYWNGQIKTKAQAFFK